MIQQPGETTEGMAKSVICSVSYKCKKNTPTIKWNYEDMQNKLLTKEISSNTYRTVANLTFIATLEDNGKNLTCTAQFISGETSDSAPIRVKSEFLHFIHSGHGGKEKVYILKNSQCHVSVITCQFNGKL